MVEAVIVVSLLALLTAMGLLMSVRSTGWTTLFMLPAVILVAYVAVFEASSLGKPMELEWRDWDKAEIISARMREGLAIYLWLDIEGYDRPRYYTLPWEQGFAARLSEGQGEQSDGAPGEIRLFIERDVSNPEEYVVHADPQRPEPPKRRAIAPNQAGRPGGNPGGQSPRND